MPEAEINFEDIAKGNVRIDIVDKLEKNSNNNYVMTSISGPTNPSSKKGYKNIATKKNLHFGVGAFAMFGAELRKYMSNN